MGVSKVVYDGKTLVDLTGDSVSPSTLAKGTTAHNAAGEPIAGEMPVETVLYVEQTLTDAQKEQARGNIAAAAEKICVVSITASTTLALNHAEKTIRVNASGAVTLTVPTNASVAFPVGTCIVVTGVGAGTVSFTPASGVTVNSKDGMLSIDGQYSAVTLYKSDTDVWELWGALA